MENKNEIKNKVKNATFFLGNGFDLNMGLDTSYEKFVYYYVNKVKSENNDVIKLKELLKRDDVNWCDLELEIGKLTESFDDANRFYNAFCDMGKELLNYLINEEKKFELKTELEKKSIAQNFMNDILIMFNKTKGNTLINVNFLTLNYTKLIHKLVSIINTDEKLHSFLTSKNIIFKDVISCHGNWEEGKICFGVNNKMQIANRKIFDNRPRVIQQLIKPERSRIINRENINKSKKIINNSNIIVNYGCSFGETDNYWVQLLSEWMGRVYTEEGIPTHMQNQNAIENKSLQIYSHSKPENTFFNATELEFEDKIKERFFSVDDERIEIIYKNIFESVKNVLK